MIILPSLEIVPAKYNGSTLLSQIPIDGTGDFTVTRVTSPTTNRSTRVNALGLIETVADNVPRLDYPLGGITAGCPALLVEPSGTNLALNSNLFSVGTPPVATVVQNQVDIFGNPNSAWLLSGADSSADVPTANNVRKITSGTVSGSTYAGTIYIKSPTGEPVTFNIRNGVTTTSTVASGDGWFRAVNASVTSTQYRAIFYTDGGAPIIICHHQVELGSVPTSYIGPVFGTALTRNADVVSVSGAVSGSIGQTEGTIYAEVDVRTLGAAKNILQIDNGTATNRIGLFVDISPTRLTFLMSSAGVTNSLSGTVATGVIKIAASYSSGNVQVFTNGSFLVSGTIATYPIVALNAISVGSRISSGVYGVFLNDRILATALYTTRLTNTQLALLTSPYTSYSSMALALSYTLG